jgi:hypothetical protein
MKTVKFLTIPLLSVLFLTACSDDDDNNVDDGPAQDTEARLYATSNTNGRVTEYSYEDDPTTVETSSFLTLSTDSEGIYYDGQADELTVVSRSLLQLNNYADISLAEDGATLNLNLSGSADLESPRDVAVNNNIYVVSDNADVDGDPNTEEGLLFIYIRNGSGFTLRNTVLVNFAVWGIEFVGNDLYAVVDKTSEVALLSNFAATYTTNITAVADKRVAIEGITRTHGIGFDGGTMVLTDIGDASDDSDGGFHIITNFVNKFNSVADGGTLPVAGNQVRVAGSSTFLGNPVSADFDADSNTVFIAERANGGGRILAFSNIDTGGNLSPVINNQLNGASSVYFYKE